MAMPTTSVATPPTVSPETVAFGPLTAATVHTDVPWVGGIDERADHRPIWRRVEDSRERFTVDHAVEREGATAGEAALQPRVTGGEVVGDRNTVSSEITPFTVNGESLRQQCSPDD